jgi:hypothetical protein
MTAHFGTLPHLSCEGEAILLFYDSKAEPMVQTMRVLSMFDSEKNGKTDLSEVKVFVKSIGIHPTVVRSHLTHPCLYSVS